MMGCYREKKLAGRIFRACKADGFTLVELIVVLAILGVLCTVSCMGMLQWKGYADGKKNDVYAQSLFLAAQTQLTRYGEQGKLTDLQNAGFSDETVCCLWVERGDYDTYLELKGQSPYVMRTKTERERRIKALYDLIEPSIADKSLLDAFICIEFDPDPKVALVYSVFYHDRTAVYPPSQGGRTWTERKTGT